MTNALPPIELTVVLPAYREAEALKKLLPPLSAAVRQLTPHHEILVVDAQERVDDTSEVCSENQVRHVFRRNGNTYGDAVRTGTTAGLIEGRWCRGPLASARAARPAVA